MPLPILMKIVDRGEDPVVPTIGEWLDAHLA
jgi:hypothetical protein